MAWQWTTKQAGVLQAQLNGVANTITLKGISGNAIMTTPENVVNTVNTILNIGGKSVVVSDKLNYDQSNGVIENG